MGGKLSLPIEKRYLPIGFGISNQFNYTQNNFQIFLKKYFTDKNVSYKKFNWSRELMVVMSAWSVKAGIRIARVHNLDPSKVARGTSESWIRIVWVDDLNPPKVLPSGWSTVVVVAGCCQTCWYKSGYNQNLQTQAT